MESSTLFFCARVLISSFVTLVGDFTNITFQGEVILVVRRQLLSFQKVRFVLGWQSPHPDESELIEIFHVSPGIPAE